VPFIMGLLVSRRQPVISATDLARRLGDVLGKVRYRGDSFIVERKGTPVAEFGPEIAERWAGLRVQALATA